MNGRSVSGCLHEVQSFPPSFLMPAVPGTKHFPGKVIAPCLLHSRQDLFARLDPTDQDLLASLGFVLPPLAAAEGPALLGGYSPLERLPLHLLRFTWNARPIAEVSPGWTIHPLPAACSSDC